MLDTRKRHGKAAAPPASQSRQLLSRARKGDRAAYTVLFMRHLPTLEHFVKREVRYYESLGVLEAGLLDPCAVLDQVYLAGLDNVKRMPAKTRFGAWLNYLAIHVTRQQGRVELHEPAGAVLERAVQNGDDIDTELWEFYQPDDVVSVEDTLTDPAAADPELWVELRETANEIEQSLSELPPNLRDCFLMRFIEGLSVDEIAALKHTAPPVIRQALHDAREALRRSSPQA